MDELKAIQEAQDEVILNQILNMISGMEVLPPTFFSFHLTKRTPDNLREVWK